MSTFRTHPENLLFSLLGQNLFQSGEANVTRSSQDFLHCSIVQYPRVFSSSSNIRILASTSHKDGAAVSVHDSAVVWTAEVTRYNFRVCVLESGPGTNGSVVVSWVAFRTAPSGVLDGTASFSTFTSGTKCDRIDFAQVYFLRLTALSSAKACCPDVCGLRRCGIM